MGAGWKDREGKRTRRRVARARHRPPPEEVGEKGRFQRQRQQRTSCRSSGCLPSTEVRADGGRAGGWAMAGVCGGEEGEGRERGRRRDGIGPGGRGGAVWLVSASQGGRGQEKGKHLSLSSEGRRATRTRLVALLADDCGPGEDEDRPTGGGGRGHPISLGGSPSLSLGQQGEGARPGPASQGVGQRQGSRSARAPRCSPHARPPAAEPSPKAVQSGGGGVGTLRARAHRVSCNAGG